MEGNILIIYAYTNSETNPNGWYAPEAVASNMSDATRYVIARKGFKPPVRTVFKVLSVQSGSTIPSRLLVEDTDQLNSNCPFCQDTSKEGIPTDGDMWLCRSCKKRWPFESTALFIGTTQSEMLIPK